MILTHLALFSFLNGAGGEGAAPQPAIMTFASSGVPSGRVQPLATIARGKYFLGGSNLAYSGPTQVGQSSGPPASEAILVAGGQTIQAPYVATPAAASAAFNSVNPATLIGQSTHPQSAPMTWYSGPFFGPGQQLAFPEPAIGIYFGGPQDILQLQPGRSQPVPVIRRGSFWIGGPHSATTTGPSLLAQNEAVAIMIAGFHEIVTPAVPSVISAIAGMTAVDPMIVLGQSAHPQPGPMVQYIGQFQGGAGAPPCAQFLQVGAFTVITGLSSAPAAAAMTSVGSNPTTAGFTNYTPASATMTQTVGGFTPTGLFQTSPAAAIATFNGVDPSIIKGFVSTPAAATMTQNAGGQSVTLQYVFLAQPADLEFFSEDPGALIGSYAQPAPAIMPLQANATTSGTLSVSVAAAILNQTAGNFQLAVNYPATPAAAVVTINVAAQTVFAPISVAPASAYSQIYALDVGSGGELFIVPDPAVMALIGQDPNWSGLLVVQPSGAVMFFNVPGSGSSITHPLFPVIMGMIAGEHTTLGGFTEVNFVAVALDWEENAAVDVEFAGPAEIDLVFSP